MSFHGALKAENFALFTTDLAIDKEPIRTVNIQSIVPCLMSSFALEVGPHSCHHILPNEPGNSKWINEENIPILCKKIAL